MDTNRFLAVLRRLDESHRFADLTSEQVLGQFAAARDEGALRELMTRHGRHVWAVCRHETGCPGLADDAFQSVFLALNQRAGSIRRPGSLTYWLDKTARRTARRLRRSRMRRAEVESIRGALPEARAGSDDIERQDLADAVRRAVAELPNRYRLPVVYRYLNDLPPPEIAKLLGLPEGTVKTQLNRALKVLGHTLASRGLGAGATAAAIEGALVGVAEAVPPALAAATVKNMVAARATAGGLAAIWVWLMQARHAALIGIAGLGLAGGTTYLLWPRIKDTPAPTVASAEVIETADERNLRIFHAQVLPELQDILRVFVLGGQPLRVIETRITHQQLVCLLEAEHRLSLNSPPWFRSRVQLVFDPRAGALRFDLDVVANGEFQTINLALPIVTKVLDRGREGISIPRLERLWSAYDAIPRELPEPISLRGAAIQGWTENDIAGFRPMFGRWYSQGNRRLPVYIYLNDEGRCLWITEHAIIEEVGGRARSDRRVIKSASVGTYELAPDGRLTHELHPDIWLTREPPPDSNK